MIAGFIFNLLLSLAMIAYGTYRLLFVPADANAALNLANLTLVHSRDNLALILALSAFGVVVIEVLVSYLTSLFFKKSYERHLTTLVILVYGRQAIRDGASIARYFEAQHYLVALLDLTKDELWRNAALLKRSSLILCVYDDLPSWSQALQENPCPDFNHLRRRFVLSSYDLNAASNDFSDPLGFLSQHCYGLSGLTLEQNLASIFAHLSRLPRLSPLRKERHYALTPEIVFAFFVLATALILLYYYEWNHGQILYNANPGGDQSTYYSLSLSRWVYSLADCCLYADIVSALGLFLTPLAALHLSLLSFEHRRLKKQGLKANRALER